MEPKDFVAVTVKQTKRLQRRSVLHVVFVLLLIAVVFFRPVGLKAHRPGPQDISHHIERYYLLHGYWPPNLREAKVLEFLEKEGLKIVPLQKDSLFAAEMKKGGSAWTVFEYHKPEAEAVTPIIHVIGYLPK